MRPPPPATNPNESPPCLISPLCALPRNSLPDSGRRELSDAPGDRLPASGHRHGPGGGRGLRPGAEAAGFDYLSAIEHVAGAHAERFAGVDTGFPAPPYLHDYPFHEPFTLFAYLAGVTSAIELVTTVLVLPQRQTVLVAKQAAEVSLLSGGRLRLGVGVGWNHAEFEALGADFHTRGERTAEQVVVLRRLWTEPLVTFACRWHTLDRVAIAPLPARIPVWMGGGTGEVTLRRIAQLADGWMPMARASTDIAGLTARCGLPGDAGRAPSSLGIQATIGGPGPASEWTAAARRWERRRDAPAPGRPP